MSDWWLGVEAALAAHSVEAPDPWAELADELPVLTVEQRSFLEQVAAQPQPTRLSLDDVDVDIDVDVAVDVDVEDDNESAI